MARDQRVPVVLLATANASAIPHICAAQDIELASHDRIGVHAWFCSRTMANLSENPALCVVLWDRNNDKGVQIHGRLETVVESTAGGGDPGRQPRESAPGGRRLLVCIEQITDFGGSDRGDGDTRGFLDEVITRGCGGAAT